MDQTALISSCLRALRHASCELGRRALSVRIQASPERQVAAAVAEALAVSAALHRLTGEATPGPLRVRCAILAAAIDVALEASFGDALDGGRHEILAEES